MEGIFQMLWPGKVLPDNLFDLAICLQGVPLWIDAWKASTAREGARQAWAMLQANYPELDICPIMRANPKGPGRSEVLLHNYFNAVMECARMTEHDCLLKEIIE
jgi:hypothetical protein